MPLPNGVVFVVRNGGELIPITEAAEGINQLTVAEIDQIATALEIQGVPPTDVFSMDELHGVVINDQIKNSHPLEDTDLPPF